MPACTHCTQVLCILCNGKGAPDPGGVGGGKEGHHFHSILPLMWHKGLDTATRAGGRVKVQDWEGGGGVKKSTAMIWAVAFLLYLGIFIDAHFCQGGGTDGPPARVHDFHHQTVLAGLPPKHSARPIGCYLHWVSPTDGRGRPITWACSNVQS